MKRATRRRYEILGVLHEHGPQFENELCILLGRRPGTLYPDLSTLEAASLITGEWEECNDGRCRRRRFRITSPDKRERGQRIGRQVDQEIADRVAVRRPQRRITFPRPAGRPA